MNYYKNKVWLVEVDGITGGRLGRKDKKSDDEKISITNFIDFTFSEIQSKESRSNRANRSKRIAKFIYQTWPIENYLNKN